MAFTCAPPILMKPGPSHSHELPFGLVSACLKETGNEKLIIYVASGVNTH